MPMCYVYTPYIQPPQCAMNCTYPPPPTITYVRPAGLSSKRQRSRSMALTVCMYILMNTITISRTKIKSI